MKFGLRIDWIKEIKCFFLLFGSLVYSYHAKSIFTDGNMQFAVYALIVLLFLRVCDFKHVLFFVFTYVVLSINFHYYEILLTIPFCIFVKYISDLSHKRYDKGLVLIFGQYFVGSFASNKIKLSFLDVMYTIFTIVFFLLNFTCYEIGESLKILFHNFKYYFDC